MRIIVNNQYTYETDYPCNIGDTVICPGGRNPNAKWEGTVTALESTYTGPCKKILGLIQEQEEPEPLAEPVDFEPAIDPEDQTPA